MALLQISEPGQSPSPHQFKRGAGIDLGTTHSLVATVDAKNGHKNNGAAVICDEQGRGIVPSVVHYASDDSVTVGHLAQQHLVTDPVNTLSSFKRWLGRNVDELAISNHYSINSSLSESGVVTVDTAAGSVNAIQASAQVLSTLASRAESYLGGQLEGVVITVPAYFDETQRQSTKDAARLAGLNVLRLINEPTAAAVAYGLDKADDRLVAIYDLGGGTFDISILQLSDGVFEVIATGGNSALGGDDFDRAIASWVANQHGVDFGQLSPADYRKLILAAKHAKQELSEHDVAQLHCQFGGQSWQVELSRDRFEQLVKLDIEKTLQACKQCVQDSGFAFSDIADVVMVGGSTRIPAVREAVATLFQQPVKIDVDPDKVVAIGAAIQADSLLGNQRQGDLLLLDVTPLSLGLEMYGGLVEKIVPRNTPIPVAKAQEFTTAKDSQTALSLHVVQGERERVEDCRSLARFQLSGIPPMVAGAAKIKVTFSVNVDGLLEVHAEEVETGVAAAINVEPANGLNEQQVTDMLRASFEFAEEDKQVRMLVEQQVESRALVESVTNALMLDGDLLTPDEYKAIQGLVAHLRSLLQDSNDVDLLRQMNKELGKATEEFAARRMDKSIKQALKGKSLDEVDES